MVRAKCREQLQQSSRASSWKTGDRYQNGPCAYRGDAPVIRPGVARSGLDHFEKGSKRAIHDSSTPETGRGIAVRYISHLRQQATCCEGPPTWFPSTEKWRIM